MAKRKAAPKRKATTTRRAKATAGTRAKTARKPAARKSAKRAASKRPAATASRAGKAKARKSPARTAKAAPKRPLKKAAKPAAARAAKAAAAPKVAARKPAPKKVVAVARPAAKAAPKAASRARAARPKKASEQVTGTHVARIVRERRTVADDDVVPTPPSSLDLDHTASASAARSGGKGLANRIRRHHDTSPELTAGDVDADWESAESSGEEAPGGDNPTPDQDVVDEIGHALGLDYETEEELDTEGKLTERDEHRWELDPESSEDFDER